MVGGPGGPENFGSLLDSARFDPWETRAFRHLRLATLDLLPLPRLIGPAVFAYVTGEESNADGPWRYCDGTQWLPLVTGGFSDAKLLGSALTLTSTRQSIPNCKVTLPAPGTYIIYGLFAFQCLGAGQSACLGSLRNTGTGDVRSTKAQWAVAAASVGDSQSTVAFWRVTTTTADEEYELQAQNVSGVGTFVVAAAGGTLILAHSVLGGAAGGDGHAESHTVVSHSDTTATGAELETLTDGSNADSLHGHADGGGGGGGYLEYNSATATLFLSNAEVDIEGCTVTLPTPGTYLILGVFSFGASTDLSAGADLFGYLALKSSATEETNIAQWGTGFGEQILAGAFNTVSQQWLITTTEDDQEYTLRGSFDGTGTAFALSPYTTIAAFAIGVGGDHDAVTLSGTPDYITLNGQDIVRALINLATDVSGLLPAANIDSAIARDSELHAEGHDLASHSTKPHNALTDLTNDDHPSVLWLPGRSGGQTPTGGIAASENLALRSTSHATKGFISFDDALFYATTVPHWGGNPDDPSFVFDTNDWMEFHRLTSQFRYYVGETLVLAIGVSGGEPFMDVQAGRLFVSYIEESVLGQGVQVPAVLKSAGWEPLADNTYDVGKAGTRWRDLYLAGVIRSGSAVPTSIQVGGSIVSGADQAAQESASLDLVATDRALILNRLTTTQRDALTALDGMALYNTTTGKFEVRENGAWVDWRHAAITVSGTPDYITLNGQDIVRGLIDLAADVSGLLPAASVVLPLIGSPTYTHVEHLNTVFHSTGWYSGGAITDAGGATIDVATGTGSLRATDSPVAQLLHFDWPAATGLAIAADSIRYIGVEYNAGSPQVVVRTTFNWNFNTDFPLGTVVNEGGTLHIQVVPHKVGDHASNMIQRVYGVNHIARDAKVGGLIFSESGTRRVVVSAGAFWVGLTSVIIPAIDTDPGVGDTFVTYSAGGQEASGVSQWPNEQYDNGGTLTNMTTNRWANLWWYLELDGDLVMVYGTAQYTSEALAGEEAVPTTLPNRLQVGGVLAARFIFQKSAATTAQILSAFESTFTVKGVTDHDDLGGVTADQHHEETHKHTIIQDDDTDTSWDTEESPDEDILRGKAGGQRVFALGAAGQLALPIQGSGGGLRIGGDVQLYRSAANMLAVPDDMTLAKSRPFLYSNHTGGAGFGGGIIWQQAGANQLEMFYDSSINNLLLWDSSLGASRFGINRAGYLAIGITAPDTEIRLKILDEVTHTSGDRRNQFLEVLAAPAGASSGRVWANQFVVGVKSGNAQNFTNALAFIGSEGKFQHNGSGVVTGGFGSLILIENTSTGTITNAWGLYILPPVNTGGGHITDSRLINLPGQVEFSANDQTRIGLHIPGTPDPGGFTGTTGAGIQLAGISGAARDGILFGVDTELYRSGADILRTPDALTVDGALTMGGDLNHDGSNIGFFGVAPSARAAAYTPTNVTPDRSYDANSTTVDEVADVLGTLIADLQSYGLLQ